MKTKEILRSLGTLGPLRASFTAWRHCRGCTNSSELQLLASAHDISCGSAERKAKIWSRKEGVGGRGVSLSIWSARKTTAKSNNVYQSKKNGCHYQILREPKIKKKSKKFSQTNQKFSQSSLWTKKCNDVFLAVAVQTRQDSAD